MLDVTGNQTASLADKYLRDEGSVFLSGTQALVRLALVQSRLDRAQGHDIAGFISGYRGSPLANFDVALKHAQKDLSEHRVQFQPGINEELAATAVWGTQQVPLSDQATVDGVFGIWYGKGPGLDRSMDVMKHANSAGVFPKGGVVAIVGDDHGAQSSTLFHQSEQLLEAAMMPVLNPSSVQELVDFGLFGFALSRFCGSWVGLKATTEVVEASAVISATAPLFKAPPDFQLPAGGLGIRMPDTPVEQERRLHGPRTEAVGAFARANPIDRMVWSSPRARLGVVTTGKAYFDVLQAFQDLGIDATSAENLGIRLYKVGLTWPLEITGALGFAAGLEQVFIVEEKRAFIEPQLVRILERTSGTRPRVFGKQDEHTRELLPTHGELSPALIKSALIRRLAALGIDVSRLTTGTPGDVSVVEPFTEIRRQAFFCSGCPHNTSTNVPEGSRALAGTGCHAFAMLATPARRTNFQTQMGGEGVNWTGQAPFTREQHVFVNMGDGTYSHSGLLAIRAAIAAQVNATYKILYNDAVAMTGGQTADAHLTVQQIAKQLSAEGARQIVIVAEDPSRHDETDLPSACTVRNRSDIDAVQRELREKTGVTVLIYDQVCAAEKRRRRKRGSYPNAPARVFINESVCEGCGDCSVQSNCISVAPVETAFGRKRRIDQSSCNVDTSCISGFCPSFVTVSGATIKSERQPLPQEALTNLPAPSLPDLDSPYRILITGVGGTGVITVGAILGMAAHLEGRACSILDLTGLAQKNGAVTSHLQIASKPDDILTVRIPAASTDLLLGCDMLVASGPAALPTVSAEKTRAVVNSHVPPMAAYVLNPELDFRSLEMRSAIDRALGSQAEYLDATALATTLFGDAIYVNLFIMGFAFQKGMIPISEAAILRAIELNGVSVKRNVEAFQAGRLHAIKPIALNAARADSSAAVPKSRDATALIEHRAAFLAEYESPRYAEIYREFVERVRLRDQQLGGGDSRLTAAVAESLAKLMAFKDEYEVARLHTSRQFVQGLRNQFDGRFKLTYHFAPPLLAKVDPVTNRPRKMAFGGWIQPLLRILAACKRLRGTRFDIFGYTEERRMERQLIVEYRGTVERILPVLSEENYDIAVQIAKLPMQMKGYGFIKMRNVQRVRVQELLLLDEFARPHQVTSDRHSAVVSA